MSKSLLYDDVVIQNLWEGCVTVILEIYTRFQTLTCTPPIAVEVYEFILSAGLSP